MKLTDITTLEEAINFNNQAKRLIDSMAKDIMIGIEYEYHVTEAGWEEGAITEDELDDMVTAQREHEIDSMIETHTDMIVDAVNGLIKNNFIPAKKRFEAGFNRDTFDAEMANFDTESNSPEGYAVIKKYQDLATDVRGELSYEQHDPDWNTFDVFFNIDSDNADDFLRDIEDGSTWNDWSKISDAFEELTDYFDTDAVNYNETELQSAAEYAARHQPIDYYDHDIERDLRNEHTILSPSASEEAEDYIASLLADEGGNDWNIDPDQLKVIDTDPSVAAGVEVITNPLPMNTTFDLMDKMLEHIRDEGATSVKTGMHVNISIRGKTFNPATFNSMKMFLLLDEAFLRSTDDTKNTKILKYPVRKYVGTVMDKFTVTDVFAVATNYVDGGLVGARNKFEGVIGKSGLSAKYQSINFNHVFDPNLKIEDRRVEFRYFGGEGYEERGDEMKEDIRHASYALLAAFDKKFGEREYMKAMVKFLDKVLVARNSTLDDNLKLNITFTEMVSLIKSGTIRSYHDLIDYVGGNERHQRKRSLPKDV